MGHASHGGSCPLCGNYASRTAAGKLYRHKGDVREVIGSGFRECRASGATFEVAQRLRANKDAGRHAHRNEGGSWLYVCGRCGREAVPQDVDPGRRCTPKGWEFCLRPSLQLPTKEARNGE